MLATIVGRAKGRSITALTSALPRNSSRTSTQAMRVPTTTLIAATIREMTIVRISAALAEGAVMASQIPPRPPSSALTVSAASGRSTIRLSQIIVMPSPRGPTPPDPGGSPAGTAAPRNRDAAAEGCRRRLHPDA